MALDTARGLIRKTLALGCPDNRFCWQGGEPSLLGIEFFQEIVRYQREIVRQGQTITNTFQTNGTLIDELWADFFYNNQFLVGLSLDGPRSVHDHYRRFGSGKGTYHLVMQAAKLLTARGVQFNILTLLTDANITDPLALYQFFRENGLTHLQFIPCVEWDPVTKASMPFSISAQALGQFYCDLFDVWMRDGFFNMSIRAFEDILIYYIDHVYLSCTQAQRCNSYLLVEHNGDVYPCDFFVYPEWKLGNIVTGSLGDIVVNPLRHEFAMLKAELPEACKECDWLQFCQGDCLKFRRDDHGGFGGLSVLCTAQRMLMEHMAPHLPSIKQRALRFRSANAG